MGMKILIVGGVAGGASAAARLRRNSEEDEIIMFERGPHVSFSNCALPYHLSGIIKDSDDLVLMNPEIFLKRFNIQARVNNEVISIDRKNKTVTVKNVLTGEVYKENYDKLILSPGARAVKEKIDGIDNANVFYIRNVVDIDRLNKFIKQHAAKDILVIGGGFIGIETAENLKKAGNNVSIVIASKQVLNIFDYDMVQILHKEIYDKGISLYIGEKIIKIENDKAVLSSGTEIDAKVVIMAKGVVPETSLAKEAGLELGNTGAIKVDENYTTSDKDIYAVGDAIELHNALTHSMMKLPLAGPALKAARIAADDIYNSRAVLKEARIASDKINNKSIICKGYISSSAIKVFDYNAASAGLCEAVIKSKDLDINYDIVNLILFDKVGLMPDACPLHLKLIFEVPGGRVLGAQAIGKGDAVKRIDIIATAIKFGGTVEDLKDLELCYAPPFSTPKDVVNYAGYIGSNLLNGDFKQVNFNKVRELVENNAYILDVREKFEYEAGHIKGAVNIPLSEIRNRTNEIPKDRDVYIHCRTGQRSYYAVLMLQHLGFENVYNITGSFLALSFYEYFNDKTTGRESIVTQYNFN